MIIHRCSYCQTSLRPNTPDANGEVHISHGICRDCLSKLMTGQGQRAIDFLLQLNIPLVVVDDCWQPIFDNRQDPPQRMRPGSGLARILDSEVFDLPGDDDYGLGGKDLSLCFSCTLKRIVRETYLTGIDQDHIPASSDLDCLAGIATPRFFISTKKRGDMVLLKLEERKEID